MAKRCTKGKSCGATCIDAKERCELELGPLVSPSLSKVTNMLESRKVEGYKPREAPEPRKGLRGLKDRLMGGEKKDLEALAGFDPSRTETNKKFSKDLKANLPANVKAAVDSVDRQVILTQKVGNHVVETTYGQREGFNYRVNGLYDTGTVTDRKEQLRIAMAVRNQYDALVRSLPEGSVIKTAPYDGDGNGAVRQKAYEKIGFGKPGAKQEMFAMKRGGRMVPATAEEQKKAYKNPETVWFAEKVDAKEELKAWIQIVTGVEVKPKNPSSPRRNA